MADNDKLSAPAQQALSLSKMGRALADTMDKATEAARALETPVTTSENSPPADSTVQDQGESTPRSE